MEEGRAADHGLARLSLKAWKESGRFLKKAAQKLFAMLGLRRVGDNAHGPALKSF